MTIKQRAWTSAICYVGLSMMTAISMWLDKIGAIELHEIKWYQWAGLLIGTMTQALITIKSLMNNTWNTKQKEEPNEKTATA